MAIKTIFISGIDTGCGKTLVTGLAAKYAKRNQKNVITQKLVQTGCQKISEDILDHRTMMGESLNAYDSNGLTCPYLFEYPASPHLAAKLENQQIDVETICSATSELEANFDYVLIEGAGGLYVPLNDRMRVIDYIIDQGYPLVLVSSSKLGSINHTLMSLELCRIQGITIEALIYNHFPADSELILKDSLLVFRQYLADHDLQCTIIEIPVIVNGQYPMIDFAPLF